MCQSLSYDFLISALPLVIFIHLALMRGAVNDIPVVSYGSSCLRESLKTSEATICRYGGPHLSLIVTVKVELEANIAGAVLIRLSENQRLLCAIFYGGFPREGFLSVSFIL